MKKLNAAFTTAILFSAIYSGISKADNLCVSTVGNTAGNNKLLFKINTMQPYYSVAVGEVLGTASVTGEITCTATVRSASWNLTLQNMPSSYSFDVCDTPLDGVGIRYKTSSGTDWNCELGGTARTIFSIPNHTAGQVFPINIPVAAEFIRTKSTTKLTPGLHTMQMPSAAKLQSWRNGGTGIKSWGNYIFELDTPLLVSSCVFAQPTTVVDFGMRNLVDFDTTSQPFKIEINNCVDEASARVFNDSVKLSFASADLTPEGYLKNQDCSDCAGNLAISVTDDNDTPIPLNQKFALKNGTFEINGDSITHNFRAHLKSHGGTTSPGNIRSIVTVIFTSI